MRQVDIKGFEDYQITDDGRVWSKKTNKWLKSWLRGDYPCVAINGVFVSIHRLVAEAFILNPDNKLQVDHIIPLSNGGTNEASNLRWVTQEENQNNPLSIINHSVAVVGDKNPMYGVFNTPSMSKVVHQYSLDGDFIKEWASAHECSRSGFDYRNVCACCSGKRKTAYGFIWRYKNDQPN